MNDSQKGEREREKQRRKTRKQEVWSVMWCWWNGVPPEVPWECWWFRFSSWSNDMGEWFRISCDFLLPEAVCREFSWVIFPCCWNYLQKRHWGLVWIFWYVNFKNSDKWLNCLIVIIYLEYYYMSTLLT